MKQLLAISTAALLTVASSHASADWFTSSETKALISKAEAGDAQAQFKVSVAFDYGRGAPRDGKEAMKWYRLAADQGLAEAQNSVGSGLQADKRFAEARPWYEKAAAQRHALATNNLAYLYDLGLGVPQDRQKGFELYLKAADLGWAEAMWNIANMYGAGQLGEKDLVKACIWAWRARRFTSPEQEQLQKFLDRMVPRLESQLTTEQQAACDKDGGDWQPTTQGSPGSSSEAHPPPT
ncbi:tetratricopeptide repeat protein [Roseateles sp. BYS78W]|uniref:Tetratricopeptide repeat protein n=1 Tax=Pelomonas candidula TaxID=3299025 RepID=A0ABW7H6E8_9BURK